MKTDNSKFIFNGYSADIKNGHARFFYTITHKNIPINFTETLAFPPPKHYTQIPEALLDRVCKNIMLMLGISYWKIYCPEVIEIRDNWLTKKEAGFWNIVYTKGLGEFFYKNKIDFRGLVQFPYIPGASAAPVLHTCANASLLLFGGGKDSIVSGELLRRAKKLFAAFSVNAHPLQKKGAELLGAPHIAIQRKIDPLLFDLNAGRGVYNGHVPASAIYAFLGLFAATLYQFRRIIASHEKSANYGNVFYLGSTINHQWSKSHEFEKMFRDYVKKCVTPQMSYISLLRPFDELHITELFSRFKKYFPVFSSCNANFRIHEKQKERWCGACPKCAFVFAALAAYIPKKEVVGIFGKNLLDDTSLVPSYEALLGIRGLKPFECVGTPRETKRAFLRIIKQGEFNDDAIILRIKHHL